MKVILQKDIQNLGDAGDVKDVADGYARNFLLPKKLVIPYSDASKRALEHQERMIKVKKEKRKKVSEKTADALKSVQLKFVLKAGEDDKLFGSVTSMDIAKKLSEAGHSIDKRKIVLEEPIKQLGEYDVEIKLDEGLSATVKVAVEKE